MVSVLLGESEAGGAAARAAEARSEARSEANSCARSGGTGTGTGSMNGSAVSTVTGLSGCSQGGEFADIVGRVQQQQRQRSKGRFIREARVQRRWAELKTEAAQMQAPVQAPVR